jgi:hypothetical protein
MKRKAAQISEETSAPHASSQEFTSLVSKYSYDAANMDDAEAKPSIAPVTPPKRPQRNSKTASTTRRASSTKKNPGYAPPSAYSHLPTPDLDCLAPDLILLFIGLNPGDSSFEARLTQRCCNRSCKPRFRKSNK